MEIVKALSSWRTPHQHSPPYHIACCLDQKAVSSQLFAHHMRGRLGDVQSMHTQCEATESLQLYLAQSLRFSGVSTLVLFGCIVHKTVALGALMT